MGAWRQRFENWVMRGQRPASEPVRLTRRRIYILPTAQGYAFATLLLSRRFLRRENKKAAGKAAFEEAFERSAGDKLG